MRLVVLFVLRSGSFWRAPATLALGGLTLGCWPSMATTMLERPQDDSASVAASATTQDGCATGGPSEVVQARLVLEHEGQPRAWIDVEVQGPAHEAREACGVLLEQETGQPRPSPKDTEQGPTEASPLVARVARACSRKALAATLPESPARLIERTTLDAIALSGATRSPDCPPAELGRIRAVVTRQTAFPSMPACETARDALAETTREPRAEPRVPQASSNAPTPLDATPSPHPPDRAVSRICRPGIGLATR